MSDFFDLRNESPGRLYGLLASLVIPRPIAWVTSVDAAGRVNAAPFSFFNLLGVDPPIIAIAVGDRDDGTPKDTAANIAATGEFVVNIADEPLAEAMVATSASLPPGENELTRAGLAHTPAKLVRAPLISAAPASLECRHERTLIIGENRIIFGLVLAAHTRAGLVDPATLRIAPGSHRPIGRLESPGGYCRTDDRFTIDRPR